MPKPLPPSRAALLWGAAFFVLIQGGLLLALSFSWTVRDPEFGRRLAAFRQRQAERGPGRPLVALLGSSRVAMNVRPGHMEINQRSGGGPIVFNFGVCRAGPMMQYLCLRRLLDAGVRPELVLAELHYSLLTWGNGEHEEIATARLRWSDINTLANEYERPNRYRRHWARDNALPTYGLNTHLLAQIAPSLLDGESSRKADEWQLDGWGWLGLPVFREDNPTLPLRVRRTIFATHADGYADLAVVAQASEHSRRCLAELVALCRREGIRLAFMLMPDPFIIRYRPGAERNTDALYTGLARASAAPVVDFRDAAVADEFADGVHLTDQGAARFTRVFEAELGPYLEGRPFEERWPVGQVRPAEAARRRLAAREAGSLAASR